MMAGRMPYRWRRTAIGGLVVGLLGCLGAPSPPERFYRLEVGPPVKSFGDPPLAGVLEVGRLRAEAVMEGREIHYRPNSSSEIRRHAYHRWADPPTTMLQAQLAQYLRAANAAEAVVTPEVGAARDYALFGRLIRMERIATNGASRVVVELELDLTRTRGRELLLSQTYREERDASGPGMTAAVAAFEDAVTALFARFLTAVGDI